MKKIHPNVASPTARTHNLMLLREICTLASTALGVARGRPDISYDEDDLHERLQLLYQTLGRIGWVADVALRGLGDTGSFARAEDWMLPEA